MIHVGYPQGDKAMYLARVRAHRETDTLVRGLGWHGETGRGCAIGCTLHSYDHAEYERQIGVPRQVAHLIDWLFEHLPEAEGEHGYLRWPERVLEAIPVGADLSGVYPAWQVRLQTRNLERIGPGDEQWRVACRAAVQGVIDLWAAGWPSWSADAEALLIAARSAARSAENAAWSAESAAWSAESAAWNAESAAGSAESAAGSAESATWNARSAEIRRQADDLIELLQAAPKGGTS
jgi:hypothetical protein